MSEASTSNDQRGALPTRQIDNGRVIVTQWQLAPGGSTGWHVHEYDYVIVPMTSGRLRVRNADGEVESQYNSGVSIARDKGIAHDVINVNEYDFAFIEIEVRD